MPRGFARILAARSFGRRAIGLARRVGRAAVRRAQSGLLLLPDTCRIMSQARARFAPRTSARMGHPLFPRRFGPESENRVGRKRVRARSTERCTVAARRMAVVGRQRLCA